MRLQPRVECSPKISKSPEADARVGVLDWVMSLKQNYEIWIFKNMFCLVQMEKEVINSEISAQHWSISSGNTQLDVISISEAGREMSVEVSVASLL